MVTDWGKIVRDEVMTEPKQKPTSFANTKSVASSPSNQTPGKLRFRSLQQKQPESHRICSKHWHGMGKFSCYYHQHLSNVCWHSYSDTHTQTETHTYTQRSSGVSPTRKSNIAQKCTHTQIYTHAHTLLRTLPAKASETSRHQKSSWLGYL